MLELLTTGLVSVWLEMAGVQPSANEAIELLVGPPIPGLVFGREEDAIAERCLQQYLQGLAAGGMSANAQGIWIQSDYQLLADNQGTIPRPAASITKVATSLASLLAWGIDHQFETRIKTAGSIANGVLQGDLIVEGSNDPFFVWEEAIALGNALNQLGIRQVTGNLIISGSFVMNFDGDRASSGRQLKQALDSSQWSREIEEYYWKMAPGTPKPQVAIAGTVRLQSDPVKTAKLAIRHQSLPLVALLKQMNIYSNNQMAQMLADALGGAQKVRTLAARAAGVPLAEIQLINGSGLGQENQISPRAAVALFMAIDRYIQPHSLNLSDVFPVAGRDRGTMDYRDIPHGAIVKTGTLWDVSALAGVLPTKDKGQIWFAVINGGGDYVLTFREEQDRLLNQLLQDWQTSLLPPSALNRARHDNLKSLKIGDASRNELLWGG
ncbi:D-alanyl-D-alanine carboxypeptidase [Oxynema sp. CENA135]|uniref:D-alanyl-D-alanine carboxypeptidase n=1 Tax=Oxynema sp. CENA135 TaxID=984206 RepID=UPI00190BABC5|nr:D-alanyl-D-alanine carboxypeptidase [Oxynema sp. CENA135]MBK4730866.1 D-alanyl-D-alanine carboxypeptidase [Oxynema sp. CENA135]